MLPTLEKAGAPLQVCQLFWAENSPRGSSSIIFDAQIIGCFDKEQKASLFFKVFKKSFLEIIQGTGWLEVSIFFFKDVFVEHSNDSCYGYSPKSY